MVKVTNRAIKLIELDVVVRFKNEELWLRKLRYAIQRQKGCLLHIIGVDNNSTDESCGILESMTNYNSVGSVQIECISKFSPGSALNLGASMGGSDFIVNLSAHCIPKSVNYFTELKNFFLEVNSKEDCAGVYSRQLPIEGSGSQNTIDLVLTYPRESRVYRRTPIFNNASSLIPRSVWTNNKFNESVSNLEDFIWAKRMIELGLVLAYTPTAEVYHQHGLHQHNSSISSRADKSLDVLLKNKWIAYDNPWFMRDGFIKTFKIQIGKLYFNINDCLKAVHEFSPNSDNNLSDSCLFENDYFVFYNEIISDKELSIVIQDTIILTAEYTIINDKTRSIFKYEGNNILTRFRGKIKILVLSSRVLKRILKK